MNAIIYKQYKSATQSPQINNGIWVLEFPSPEAFINNVTGWVSSYNTQKQIVLKFTSQEEAIAYAKTHSISFEILPTHEKSIRPNLYSKNFV